MKHLLLAAAALIAAPALAQTTPAGDPGMPAQQTTPAGDPAAQSTPPAGDPAMPAAPGQTTGGQSTGGQTTGTMPMSADGTSPAGGYQPTGNGMSAPMQPGGAVTFKQAPTPAEAYPAPAPMAKYPICKKGQFDHCMQRRGK